MSETIAIIQIDQPLCSRAYGDGVGSPPLVSGGCQAILGSTGTRKCFNTRFTCQDPDRYNPETLTLSFSRDQQGLVQNYGYVIPAVLEVQTAPGLINLGGMFGSASALGERERVTIKMADFLHSDLLVDKYRLERATPGSISKGFESDTWVVGSAAPTGYVLNQDVPGESTFAVREGPYGEDVVVNVCESKDTPSGDPGPDGGWGMSAYNIFINPLKSHLMAVWVKRVTPVASPTVISGQFYWGLHTNSATDVLTLAGASDTNPYTVSGAVQTLMPEADKWYLAVGFIHENGYGTTDTGISGIYDPDTGAKVFSGVEYKWPSDAHRLEHRCYHYYNQTISGEAQQMWDPKVYECTVSEADGLIERVLRGGGYDPFRRGTFWGKWLARNPYHTGYDMRVYDGNLGDALEDMRVRHYVIDRIDGPADGEVSVIAKDLFSLIEAQKAVAPLASRGELSANMTGSPATFSVVPSGIGNTDYLASGYVQIGDEIIAYTRSGDTFTVTGRAQFGTTQANHEDEDLVQQVLTYTSQLAHNIVYDLLCRFTALGSTGSPTESPFIDKATWDLRASELVDQFTARICKPTPVADLIAELAVQSGFSVWPDVSTGMIEFAPLRAGSISPTITDRDIVDKSLSLKREIEKRLSQVWVYYGMVNPTADVTERRNYRSRLVVADLEAEDEELYGTPQIKEIFSRWIPQFGRQAAERCGERMLTMFRDPPTRASFTLHASRDGELSLARYFALQTADIQDDAGEEQAMSMAVTRIKRGENEIAFEAHTIVLDEEEVDPGGNPIREIHIENDSTNLNIRTIHDLIYPVPTGGSPGESVDVFVLHGVTVGSTSTGSPALRTGSWPAGVTLRLFNSGLISGAGGNGGNGGFSGESGQFPGTNGTNGGDALLVEYALIIDNFEGQIWGGGGGGGGGGGSVAVDTGFPFYMGGGGGGGGRGSTPGSPGSGGSIDGEIFPEAIGNPGSSGTSTSAGSGGQGGDLSSFGPLGAAGDGGNGGNTGNANGSNGTTGNATFNGSPAPNQNAAGGTAGTGGKYINGIGLVTWAAGSPTSTGDLRGNVS